MQSRFLGPLTTFYELAIITAVKVIEPKVFKKKTFFTVQYCKIIMDFFLLFNIKYISIYSRQLAGS